MINKTLSLGYSILKLKSAYACFPSRKDFGVCNVWGPTNSADLLHSQLGTRKKAFEVPRLNASIRSSAL